MNHRFTGNETIKFFYLPSWRPGHWPDWLLDLLVGAPRLRPCGRAPGSCGRRPGGRAACGHAGTCGLRPAAPVLGLPCTPAACLPAERRRPCESPRAPMRWTAGCGWIGIGFAVRLGFGLESGCKFFSGPPYSITGRQAQLVSSSSSTSSTPKACIYHQKSMEGLQGGFMAPAAVGEAPAPPDPPLDPPLFPVTKKLKLLLSTMKKSLLFGSNYSINYFS